jgi:hypothetical protein
VVRGTVVACSANLGYVPRGAHDSDHAPHGTYDSDCAMHGPGIHDSVCVSCAAYNSSRATRFSGIPILLAPHSGYAGATTTASTLAFCTGEGRTSVTSGQPPSDDHAGEVELRATWR